MGEVVKGQLQAMLMVLRLTRPARLFAVPQHHTAHASPVRHPRHSLHPSDVLSMCVPVERHAWAASSADAAVCVPSGLQS